ncbi:hypothetical protein PIB30_092345 [Stylosanthes scabra]|uniref:Transmembrane protein n=1 Tax=Stylosanthes scabra TaxID=79078 RepID=A0ABU6QUQ9_9FABA|nr:hypothetical protein [Stylosanthes scabra]
MLNFPFYSSRNKKAAKKSLACPHSSSPPKLHFPYFCVAAAAVAAACASPFLHLRLPSLLTHRFLLLRRFSAALLRRSASRLCYSAVGLLCSTSVLLLLLPSQGAKFT